MSDISLVLPNKQHKQAVIEYTEEFLQNNETLHGGAGLGDVASFEEWLERANASQSSDTTPEGRVPSTVFLAFRNSDQRLVGIIDIRHTLNDYLESFGGHIGYSVRKSERRKGYATKMLAESLNFCRELGIDKVLLTCDKANEGSAVVIKSNGGELENEVLDAGGKMMQRYWISLP